MSSNGIKSGRLHPYQIAMQERTCEPLEWSKVSDAWILKYGGKIERKKLNDKLKKDKV